MGPRMQVPSKTHHCTNSAVCVDCLRAQIADLKLKLSKARNDARRFRQLTVIAYVSHGAWTVDVPAGDDVKPLTLRVALDREMVRRVRKQKQERKEAGL